MNQDILLSKIVSNSTDTTWAQAYTTLNVYITLSIESSATKESVATVGKDLLERLQREFFALDEKTLDNIKNAVGNVTKTINEDFSYSILVGAITNGVLYLVIASEGQVIIKRNDRVGTIAKGLKNELHGFSGKLMHDDIIVLETADFANKIPLSSLSEYLSGDDISEISENITPLIHEGSKGTEGAIVIQYKNIENDKEDEDFSINETEEKEKNSDELPIEKENLWTKPNHENRNIEELVEEENSAVTYEEAKKSNFRLPSIPAVNFKNRNTIIIFTVIVLAAILIGGVFVQTTKQENQKREQAFEKIYNPVKEKFDEGKSLTSLNSTLALEDLQKSLSLANDALKNYKEGSSEYQKLTDLKKQIQETISSLGGGGEAQNVKEFLKPQGSIKSITAISARDGQLVVLDSTGEQVVAVDSNGKPDKSYDLESKASYIASDDKFIYTMGDSVTRIDKGNGSVTVVLEEVKGSGIDLFGSNFYVLDGKDIEKYRAPSETSSSYFTKDPNFSGTPTSFSISGSVWVLEENGTISRFTKGVNDNIDITGLKAPFSNEALVYADPEIDNVYVMDIKNQRVVVLTSKGEFAKQYEGSFIKNATSFAIDEENNTGYVVADGKIMSFDL